MRSNNKNKIRTFIEYWNHWQAGNGIIATPIRILGIYGSVIAGLSVYNIKLPIWFYFVSAIIAIVCIIAVGYVWNNTDLYKEQCEFSNTRNPFTKEMRRKIQ